MIFQLNFMKIFYFLLCFCAFSSLNLLAQKTYDVGPGYPKTQISQVPWLTLGAGDVVNIHYDLNGYHEKFLISASGTAAQPIKIIGIAGPNGENPSLMVIKQKLSLVKLVFMPHSLMD